MLQLSFPSRPDLYCSCYARTFSFTLTYRNVLRRSSVNIFGLLQVCNRRKLSTGQCKLSSDSVCTVLAHLWICSKSGKNQSHIYPCPTKLENRNIFASSIHRMELLFEYFIWSYNLTPNDNEASIKLQRPLWPWSLLGYLATWLALFKAKEVSFLSQKT